MSDPRIIAIGDKARLIIGSVDVTVEQYKVSAAGKPRWEFSGSYSKLSTAAQSFIDGRNVGLLLPEQMADIGELITALFIASGTVAQAVKSAGGGQ